jgi:hypothetical protein
MRRLPHSPAAAPGIHVQSCSSSARTRAPCTVAVAVEVTGRVAAEIFLKVERKQPHPGWGRLATHAPAMAAAAARGPPEPAAAAAAAPINSTADGDGGQGDTASGSEGDGERPSSYCEVACPWTEPPGAVALPFELFLAEGVDFSSIPDGDDGEDSGGSEHGSSNTNPARSTHSAAGGDAAPAAHPSSAERGLVQRQRRRQPGAGAPGTPAPWTDWEHVRALILGAIAANGARAAAARRAAVLHPAATPGALPAAERALAALAREGYPVLDLRALLDYPQGKGHDWGDGGGAGGSGGPGPPKGGAPRGRTPSEGAGAGAATLEDARRRWRLACRRVRDEALGGAWRGGGGGGGTGAMGMSQLQALSQALAAAVAALPLAAPDARVLVIPLIVPLRGR